MQETSSSESSRLCLLGPFNRQQELFSAIDLDVVECDPYYLCLGVREVKYI